MAWVQQAHNDAMMSTASLQYLESRALLCNHERYNLSMKEERFLRFHPQTESLEIFFCTMLVSKVTVGKMVELSRTFLAPFMGKIHK